MKIKKLSLAIILVLISSASSPAQSPTITDYVNGMDKHEGYFTYYWDNKGGKVLLEIDQIDEEFLFIASLTAGLGSNDVGLDRNRLGSTKIVSFKKIGPKILLVQPNYGFRANSDNPDEVKAVTDAFATSVIFSFKVIAEDKGRALIDISPLLLSDLNNISSTFSRSGQGEYRIDEARSALYLENTKNFPFNSEFEALITFTGRNAGNFIRSVSPDGNNVSLRQHLSFVKLPDAGFENRAWDPRSAFGAMSYMDFASPIDEPITKRNIRRHRLEKKDPSAKISEPVEPIVYYVDRGAPEPIRSALIEGASWWNLAFEAAGYKNAFQVKVLPQGADPMDVRYNMINWIHRSTRGWSYGSSVTDPRTGEIIKGHIALGSQRIRQDFLIASGLVAEYEEGKNLDPAIMQMALLRIKQLSCHEVGHTLGLNHNYASSVNKRASVMDYPHPLVILKGDRIDLSDAYTDGIGEWDKVSIKFGYSDFPEGADEKAELAKILDSAFSDGLLFLTDQDSRGLHPLTHVWDNGKHPVDELKRVMKIREIALKNFSVKKVPPGESLSSLEEILVPVYLFHRYQIEATTSVIGGLYYGHNVRGGAQTLPEFVPSEEQIEALNTLLFALKPENLAISEDILSIIPPRAPGFRQSRELFPGSTGLAFDPLSAAGNVAEIAMDKLLDPERAARVVLYSARNQNQPHLEKILSEITVQTIHQKYNNDYYAEIGRMVNNVVLTRLIYLSAGSSTYPQVRAIAFSELLSLKMWLEQNLQDTDRAYAAHYNYMLKQINFYFENPDQIKPPARTQAPQGAPIGSY